MTTLGAILTVVGWAGLMAQGCALGVDDTKHSSVAALCVGLLSSAGCMIGGIVIGVMCKGATP